MNFLLCLHLNKLSFFIQIEQFNLLFLFTYCYCLAGDNDNIEINIKKLIGHIYIYKIKKLYKCEQNHKNITDKLFFTA